MQQTQDNVARNTREMVAFRVADQDYLIDILSVREIRGWSRPSRLPHAPAYVLGVINLRGTVVPVLDLGLRLGLPHGPDGGPKVIIVTAVAGRIAGLMVDAVTDILPVLPGDIQTTPDLALDATRSVIAGLTIIDGRMVRILDPVHLFVPADGAAA